jgi:hypothetical protein
MPRRSIGLIKRRSGSKKLIIGKSIKLSISIPLQKVNYSKASVTVTLEGTLMLQQVVLRVSSLVAVVSFKISQVPLISAINTSR